MKIMENIFLTFGNQRIIITIVRDKPMIGNSNPVRELSESRRWCECGSGMSGEWTCEGEPK